MKATFFSTRKATPVRNRASFTLVEILVAVAILTFILLLLAQMMAMVNKAYAEGRGRIDNFVKSRAMLDLVATDLQKGVFRTDLPAFSTAGGMLSTNGTTVMTNTAGNGLYAFYTRRAGATNDATDTAPVVRDLSLVVYSLDTNNAILERTAYPIPWTLSAGNWSSYLPFQTNMSSAMPSNQPTNEVAAGVLDFHLLFRQANGNITNAYPGYISTNPVISIGIGLAVVDGQTLKLLQQLNLVSGLSSTLSGYVSGSNSIKSDWDSKLNATFYSGYPKPLGTGLRTFERWVPCQPPF